MSMVISWTALDPANNGGDTVTFYALDVYNSATSTWNQLNNDINNLYLTYTYTVTSNFMASTYYQFRVRPKNGVGYNVAGSTVLLVLSDGVPNSMYTPT